MSNGTELALRPDQGINLFGGATPREVIEAATEAANELHSVIETRRLFTRIGTSEHVRVEGWQTLGVMTGVFAIKGEGVEQLPWPTVAGAGLPAPPDPGREPRRSAPEYVAWRAGRDELDSWEAQRALIRARDRGLAFGFKASFRATKGGQDLGWGESSCTRAEDNWATKPDYQLRSMAQTRAQSKALRQPLGFVVSLAGYETTPAEEVGGGAGPEPAPPLDATPVLSADAIAEVAVELQRVWPNFDGHGFMRVLAKRMGGAVPEPAGVALRAWAWWVGRTPESALDEPPEPPEGATEPEPAEVVEP